MRTYTGNGRTAGICFNLRKEGHTSDGDEEYDEIETVHFLREQLEDLGFEVTLMEQAQGLLGLLRDTRPVYVLNIAEGVGKTRSRESQVPCLLEWMDIPYYGSDPLTMGITLDKMMTSAILDHSGVSVPAMVTVGSAEDMDALDGFFRAGGEYIVKPRWEGSSKGIFGDSVVGNAVTCAEKAEYIIKEYGQPAVVEEFLEGEEVTAAVCGNSGETEIMGMMRISPREAVRHFVYSLENKREWQDRIKYERADRVMDAETVKRCALTALAAFRALGIRDIARIDLRLGADARPRVIDVNPLPGLSPRYSDLMLMSGLYGLDFKKVVRKILDISLKRNRITV